MFSSDYFNCFELGLNKETTVRAGLLATCFVTIMSRTGPRSIFLNLDVAHGLAAKRHCRVSVAPLPEAQISFSKSF